MANEKLISFDLGADFGFFKKPDYNDGLLLSYNMLHKPALLGILGAIAGLAGYQRKGDLPEYYTRLKDLMIGIQPLNHEKGNFQKSVVKYTNTVGYANLDGNLLIEETLLIKPAYRCYLLLEMDNKDHEKLYGYIRAGHAEFIPYLGKNEYQAWLDEKFVEYDFGRHIPKSEFKIETVFLKSGSIRKQKVTPEYSFTTHSMTHQGSYCYFELLPVGFNEELMQYDLGNFAFTDWTLKQDAVIDNLFEIADGTEIKKVIQLY